MIPPARTILNLSLGGGTRHKIATSIVLVVAIEKGYMTENTSTWRGGKALPDGVIYKAHFDKHWVREPGSTFWIEIVDSHDPRIEWHLAGYAVDDVITFDISEKSYEQIEEEARRRIP